MVMELDVSSVKFIESAYLCNTTVSLKTSMVHMVYGRFSFYNDNFLKMELFKYKMFVFAQK